MSYHWDTLFWWNTSLQNTFCVIHPYAMQHKLWGCTERWSFFLSKNWSIHLVNAPAADYKTLHALKQTQNKASIVCLLFPSYHLDSSAVPVGRNATNRAFLHVGALCLPSAAAAHRTTAASTATDSNIPAAALLLTHLPFSPPASVLGGQHPPGSAPQPPSSSGWPARPSLLKPGDISSG